MEFKLQDDRIFLRDSQGRLRILVSLDPPGIDFFGEDGIARVSISTYDGEGHLYFANKEGEAQLGIGIDSTHKPSVELSFGRIISILGLHDGEFKIMSGVLDEHPTSDDDTLSSKKTDI